MRLVCLIGLCFGLALAQVAPRPVPPPRPPEEPRTPQTVTLEVQVWRQGQPAAGLRVLLWRLGPGGRQLPAEMGAALRLTDSEGRARWNGLEPGHWGVQLRDPQSGLLLSVPLTADFMTAPLVVGPYRIQLGLTPA